MRAARRFLRLLGLLLLATHVSAAGVSRSVDAEAPVPSRAPVGTTALQVANWLERGLPGTVLMSGRINPIRLPDLSLGSLGSRQAQQPPPAAEAARDAVAAVIEPGADHFDLWLRAVREDQPPSLDQQALPESSIPGMDSIVSAPSADKEWLFAQAREAAKGFDPARFATPEGRDEAAQAILLRIMDNAPEGLSDALGSPPPLSGYSRLTRDELLDFYAGLTRERVPINQSALRGDYARDAARIARETLKDHAKDVDAIYAQMRREFGGSEGLRQALRTERGVEPVWRERKPRSGRLDREVLLDIYEAWVRQGIPLNPALLIRDPTLSKEAARIAQEISGRPITTNAVHQQGIRRFKSGENIRKILKTERGVEPLRERIPGLSYWTKEILDAVLERLAENRVPLRGREFLRDKSSRTVALIVGVLKEHGVKAEGVTTKAVYQAVKRMATWPEYVDEIVKRQADKFLDLELRELVAMREAESQDGTLSHDGPVSWGQLRRWAKSGITRLVLTGVPLRGKKGRLHNLGERIDLFPEYAGGTAAVLLTWSAKLRRYAILEVAARKGERSDTFTFKTFWGRSPLGYYTLLKSSRLSPGDQGRRWAKKFPELRVEDGKLNSFGGLSALGQNSVAGFGPVYKNLPVGVFLSWSSAADRYVPTRIDIATTEGRKPFPMKTLWGRKRGEAAYVLLDSYKEDYHHDAPPQPSREYPELKVEFVDIDARGYFSVLGHRAVGQFPSEYAGGTAVVFLMRSPRSGRYVVTHAEGRAEAREPHTLWFTLVANYLEDGERPSWPPSSVRQSSFQGKRRWWWVQYHAQVRPGDTLWLPWSPVAPGLFLSQANAILYRFDEAAAGPMYEVLRWVPGGPPNFLGVWARDRWVDVGDLAQYRAQLNLLRASPYVHEIL